MEGSCRMIDEFAKDNLHGRLRRDREALLWKLEGLSEYDVRRPLTATGTNLLGLVKHVAMIEWNYLGACFDRAVTEGVPEFDPPEFSDMWATAEEASDSILEFYGRVARNT